MWRVETARVSKKLSVVTEPFAIIAPSWSWLSSPVYLPDIVPIPTLHIREGGGPEPWKARTISFSWPDLPENTISDTSFHNFRGLSIVIKAITFTGRVGPI